MMTKGLIDLAKRLPGRRVAVIGDVMLDHFLIGRVDRISPEAPVPVVRFERDEFRLGGAANVAHNVQALGGKSALVGLVGDDEASRVFRRALGASGISDQHLVVDRLPAHDAKGPRRSSGRNQQVIRLDYEDDGDPAAAVAANLNQRPIAASTDAGGRGAVGLSEGRGYSGVDCCGPSRRRPRPNAGARRSEGADRRALLAAQRSSRPIITKPS